MNTKWMQAEPTANAAQLEAAFRQVMQLPPEPGNEAPLREQLHLLMGALTARQDLKYDAKLQSMLLACRLRLRRLLHGCAATAGEDAFCPGACELRELAEDICTAADLLLSSLGRSVLFEADDAAFSAACAPRELGWLLLEAICNAFCHTTGQEIRVILEQRGAAKPGRGGEGYLLLRTESAGALDLPRLHVSAAQPGSGVSAMLRIAWLHRGSLLWHEAARQTTCTLRLPLRQKESPGGRCPTEGFAAIKGAPAPPTKRPHLRLLEGNAAANANAPLPPAAREQPDFVQLLCDKLSPVYTALAPCIGTTEG
jgi:hypothetical protein